MEKRGIDYCLKNLMFRPDSYTSIMNELKTEVKYTYSEGPIFECSLKLDGKIETSGFGKSKAAAKNSAAQKYLNTYFLKNFAQREGNGTNGSEAEDDTFPYHLLIKYASMQLVDDQGQKTAEYARNNSSLTDNNYNPRLDPCHFSSPGLNRQQAIGQNFNAMFGTMSLGGVMRPPGGGMVRPGGVMRPLGGGTVRPGGSFASSFGNMRSPHNRFMSPGFGFTPRYGESGLPRGWFAYPGFSFSPRYGESGPPRRWFTSPGFSFTPRPGGSGLPGSSCSSGGLGRPVNPPTNVGEQFNPIALLSKEMPSLRYMVTQVYNGYRCVCEVDGLKFTAHSTSKQLAKFNCAKDICEAFSVEKMSHPDGPDPRSADDSDSESYGYHEGDHSGLWNEY